MIYFKKTSYLAIRHEMQEATLIKDLKTILTKQLQCIISDLVFMVVRDLN
jgi:hypothetical protein